MVSVQVAGFLANKSSWEDEEASTVIRLRRETPDRQHVYLLQGELTRLIKIGVADNAESRVRSVALSSPDRLKVLASVICWRKGAMEREAHLRFAAERMHGEWFRPSEALMHFVWELRGQSNEAWLARLQAACDEPRRPKGRRPRTPMEREL